MTGGLSRLPRAVLFDWDNTLVDSWEPIREALNLTFRQFGMPEWSLEETRQRVARSLSDSFPALFGDAWIQARTLYLDHFRATHLERLAVLPGAADLVAELHEAGCYLGVVSNKTGSLLRREVEALGWTRRFGAVVGAGDASADKPDAAPVRLALQPSGVKADADVWFIGDTELDMNCARAAGCRPIFIGDTPGRGENVARFGNCNDLLRVIQSLRTCNMGAH